MKHVFAPRRGTSCSRRGPCRLADIRGKHTNPNRGGPLPQQRHLPFIGTRKSVRPFGRAPGRRRCPDFFAHSVVHRDTLLLREPAALGDGSRCPNSSRATSSDVCCPPRTPASHPTFPLLPSAGLRGSRLDGRCSGTSRPEFDEAGLCLLPVDRVAARAVATTVVLHLQTHTTRFLPTSCLVALCP